MYGKMAAAVAMCVLAGACATVGPRSERPSGVIKGESLVLAGETPGLLCHGRLVKGSVQVRSTYLEGKPETVVYEEGRDYVVDYGRGSIARVPGSRIPDFSANVLYGQKEFDHSKFPGYGNLPFFAWVDYKTRANTRLVKPSNQSTALKRTYERLKAGGPFKVIVYGDSISAGGEASEPRLQFGQLYSDWLQLNFPKAQVTFENGATGGDSTRQGLQRLEEKVLTRQPDLVLVGFGMNDHNKGGVPPEEFEANLTTVTKTIKERTGADVILFSTFPPHPDWIHSSHRMEVYAAATERVAKATGSAYGDVYSAYMKVFARKDPSSVLANNINHPNDYGHRLYFEVFKSIEFWRSDKEMELLRCVDI